MLYFSDSPVKMQNIFTNLTGFFEQNNDIKCDNDDSFRKLFVSVTWETGI